MSLRMVDACVYYCVTPPVLMDTLKYCFDCIRLLKGKFFIGGYVGEDLKHRRGAENAEKT
jgi:hypothetical protein